MRPLLADSCRLVLALGVLAALAPAGHAIEYGGGGSRSKDCLVTFDAAFNFPPSRPRMIRCTDGDPTCDADGAVNGVCEFDVTVCANSTFEPRCAPDEVAFITVDHAVDDGSPRFDPDFQAVQQSIDSDIQPPTTSVESCTAAVPLRVPIVGPTASGSCKRSKKILRTRAETPPGPDGIKRDRDTIKLICEPSSCDPTVLFTGTFDRIQRQVFDVSCSTGGCHDSESFAGGLLLESGSAYGALVNVGPSNPQAAGNGWLRVTPSDPETSFLYHKVEGGLDVGLGERMPRDAGKLKSYLRDIIELWILADAPETDWVPGTD